MTFRTFVSGHSKGGRSTLSRGPIVANTVVVTCVLLSSFIRTQGVNTAGLDLERDASEHVFIADADQRGLDITRDIAIELWVKLESDVPINDSYAFVSKADPFSDYSFVFSVENDQFAGQYLDFRYSGDGTSDSATTQRRSVALVAGQWHHLGISASVSNQVVTFFVDGTELPADTIIGNGSSSIFDGSAPFRIGAGNGGQAPFDGLIDDVRIFRRQRTAAQVSAELNDEISPTTPGLVGYWKFNGSFFDEAGRNDLSFPRFVSDVPFPVPRAVRTTGQPNKRLHLTSGTKRQ